MSFAAIHIDSSISNLITKNNLETSKNTLQFYCHGKPGTLFINGEWLKKEAIADYILPKIERIHQLNIYGCNFGQGKEGKEAVEYLEKTLKINVAASNNITGKDGDWILEVGHPFDVITIRNFQYNLGDGTIGNPYTSLAQAACNAHGTAGIKYFNLSGTTFSTYVDAQGYILVANDSSSNHSINTPTTGDSTLNQTTSLNTTSKGILSSTVLSKFGATTQIKR